MDSENQLTTTIGQKGSTLQQATERQRKAVILGKLALHYWRPDFTAEQARMVMGDYLDDLESYASFQVQAACDQYRRTPGNEFFPKICQLIEILSPPQQFADIPPRRLPSFRSPPALTGPAPKLRSVGDILRANGQAAAAEKWDSR